MITSWGSDLEREIHRRIKIAVYAYAYEIEHVNLVDDYVYDALALTIQPAMSTGHSRLDSFFLHHFDPSTGMWIHRHPELDKVAQLYRDRYHPAESSDFPSSVDDSPILRGY